MTSEITLMQRSAAERLLGSASEILYNDHDYCVEVSHLVVQMARREVALQGEIAAVLPGNYWCDRSHFAAWPTDMFLSLSCGTPRSSLAFAGILDPT